MMMAEERWEGRLIGPPGKDSERRGARVGSGGRKGVEGWVFGQPLGEGGGFLVEL